MNKNYTENSFLELVEKSEDPFDLCPKCELKYEYENENYRCYHCHICEKCC